MNRKITYLFNITICLLLIGCEEKCGPFPEKFDVIGIGSNLYKIIYYKYDSSAVSVSLGPIDTNHIYEYDSISIGLYSDYKEIYSQNILFLNPFSIKPAYACNPKILYSIDTLQNIIIVSNSNWSDNILAGDTLNNIIEIILYESDSPHNPKLPIDLNEFLSQKPTAKMRYYFKFKSAPSYTASHQFTIHYYHTNGEYYSTTTKQIMIKP